MIETQEKSSPLVKYYQILKQRWVPALNIFLPTFLIAAIALTIFKKPTYLAEGKLRFQRTNTTSVLTGVGREISTLETVGRDTQTNPLKTEAEVITSLPVIQKTIRELDLQDNKGDILKPKDFLKRLTVKDVKGADVIQITYQDKHPEIATQVVNNLMDNYLEQNVSSLRAEASAARKFIEKQLPNAEFVVRNAEAELAKFKEKYKVVSLEEEATRAVGVIAELQQEINTVQSEFANVEAQSQQVRKQLEMDSQQALATTSLSQTPGVQDVLREIQLLETQLASRRTVLQDTHPFIIDLEEKIQSLNGLMQKRIQQVGGGNQPQPNTNLQLGEMKQRLSERLAELEANRLGLANQATTLSNLLTGYRQRLNNLPRLEQIQRQLERKVEAAQTTYSLLLQKLQESRIAENQNVGNASIITKAEVPEEPMSSPIVLYLGAGVLASMAAVAAVYILEARDKSIRTVQQAQELFGFTLLGVIPSFNKSKKPLRNKKEPEVYNQRLVVRNAPRSPISEAFRMLRANLKFISADKELKVIVVTSSVPTEGKSTVAANLAIAMAQMERKVLLIDGDLHRPVQHHIWELPNHEGLSNVIVKEAQLTTAVKPVMENLDVLSAGVVPPSPASLLDSKKMAALIENFTSNYDFVIIDAPSLTVAADAATLGHMADGVLFVARPGVVDYASGLFAKEFLNKSGQNVLGLVVNGVHAYNEPYSRLYLANEFYSQAQDSEVPKAVRVGNLSLW
ncbi:polysaccharide biosynthesis tyrosine autokinase [Chlorogloeopsis sp. ULAP01]|uniref:GumC family protein n=1 Tax=Chlorogloeopsis sp. ULAP01 TaxID=3056483 RepID=UPI0025AB4625|nr:polysaccharide biosynthesis tyrosine autokinase [Chlorogloeopsis sp. ULAP01]MDM9385221.1 polysaccharide biosynthesis tyrosine autokinase [Chlorogloeopsis sp. ULAP01]